MGAKARTTRCGMTRRPWGRRWGRSWGAGMGGREVGGIPWNLGEMWKRGRRVVEEAFKTGEIDVRVPIVCDVMASLDFRSEKKRRRDSMGPRAQSSLTFFFQSRITGLYLSFSTAEQVATHIRTMGIIHFSRPPITTTAMTGESRFLGSQNIFSSIKEPTHTFRRHQGKKFQVKAFLRWRLVSCWSSNYQSQRKASATIQKREEEEETIS